MSETNTYKQRSIAVIGVSTDSQKYGHKVFSDMVKAGWQVEGVNPKGGRVAGRELYPDLASLPTVPDLVVTVVPPSVTERIVEHCAALGVKEIWMQPGSESQAAIEAAVNAGMTVTSQACIMVRSGLW